MKLPKNLVILIITYLVSLIIIYGLLEFSKRTENIFVRTIIFSIPVLLILVLSKMRKVKITIPKIKGEDHFIRYDMFCHKCNWEWMSHSAKKAPSQCPNCNTTQKNMLEVIGWRKMNISTKKDKDLRAFFRA